MSPKSGGRSTGEEFEQDFVNDVMPYIEKDYRVYADGAHRAIAGLCRGGKHTLHIVIPHLDWFACVDTSRSGMIDWRNNLIEFAPQHFQ